MEIIRTGFVAPTKMGEIYDQHDAATTTKMSAGGLKTSNMAPKLKQLRNYDQNERATPKLGSLFGCDDPRTFLTISWPWYLDPRLLPSVFICCAPP